MAKFPQRAFCQINSLTLESTLVKGNVASKQPQSSAGAHSLPKYRPSKFARNNLHPQTPNTQQPHHLQETPLENVSLLNTSINTSITWNYVLILDMMRRGKSMGCLGRINGSSLSSFIVSCSSCPGSHLPPWQPPQRSAHARENVSSAPAAPTPRPRGTQSPSPE